MEHSRVPIKLKILLTEPRESAKMNRGPVICQKMSLELVKKVRLER